jgi:hypothetical protein
LTIGFIAWRIEMVERCKCGKWLYSEREKERHQCDPEYECYKEFDGDPGDPYIVNAINHLDAAEAFYDRYDADMDYPDEIDVMVRKVGDVDWRKYSMYAESVREYHGKEVLR